MTTSTRSLPIALLTAILGTVACGGSGKKVEATVPTAPNQQGAAAGQQPAAPNAPARPVANAPVQVTLRLPARAGLAAELQEHTGGYHLTIAPEAGAAGTTVDETKPWSGAALSVALQPGAAYRIRLHVGRLDETGATLKQAMLTTEAEGIVLPASAFTSGQAPAIDVTLREPSGAVVPVGDAPIVVAGQAP